ncbi:YARHG domain-containing protein [Butyrivibrio sp. INlla16]|uniref:YARHG domain-containing protein n=1 Tax=Butyrivibrio sp. INlla16 TaxID=1520807 RepID=UPI000888ABA2|nr:YARHG domain-containing protein [Butyrivibrio sp. INlla16]SDB45175.1 zinc-ribbon domain-containing protein [Butyrivibrio sp. INlla16]
MFCKYCGAQIDDSAAFCPKCGKKLAEASNDFYMGDGLQKKKSNLPLFAAVVTLCLVLGIGAGVLAVLHFTKSKDAAQAEETAAEVNGEEADDGLLSAIPLGGNDSGEAGDEAVQTDVQEQTAQAEGEAAGSGNVDDFLKGSGSGDATAQPADTGLQADINAAADPGMDGADQMPNNDYILPESSTRLYTESELMGFTAEELRIARNEIYARYGRRFQDPELQSYFDSKAWYVGRFDPDEFDKFGNDMLSDIEKKNTDIIKKVEDFKS